MPDKESEFSFVWKVENFSMLPHQLGEELKSPKFVVDTWKNIDFCLWLYPRGETKEGSISLFLYKEPKDLDLKLNFTLTIESTKPSEEIRRPIIDHVLEGSLGFPSFKSLNEIYASMKLYLPKDTLTIRCEISPVDETNSTELIVNHESKSASKFLRKNCVSRTCIQVQRRSIMWCIRNVKERLERPENSSIILTGALKNSPSLKLTLNFNKITGSDYIQILVKQAYLSLKDERLFVKCKITVTSAHEEYQASKTSDHLFKLSTSDVWSFPEFITTSMLTDEKYLHVDDILLLRCELAFSYKGGVHHLENNYMPFNFETKKKNSELSTCFENMYTTGEFCDIELKAGGKIFPYYKIVLCARSSVFGAMFKNNMKEKSSSVVEIDDVDEDTLQRMLTYMHSDVIEEDLLPEDACMLYKVADKYDVASLKRRCSDLLMSGVSVVNVCELLVLADAHHDNFLMTGVCDFICSHTNEVFHSAHWESFMDDNPKLSSRIMHKMWVGKYQL